MNDLVSLSHSSTSVNIKSGKDYTKAGLVDFSFENFLVFFLNFGLIYF